MNVKTDKPLDYIVTDDQGTERKIHDVYSISEQGSYTILAGFSGPVLIVKTHSVEAIHLAA